MDKTSFLIVQNGFVLRSMDGGFSWKKLVKGIDTQYHLISIAVSPSFHFDRTLYLSTEGDGIFKSNDRGSSWFKVNNGLSNLRIDLLSISTNFSSDKIVLASGSDGGLYKTRNGGDLWYQVIDESKQIRAIAFFPLSQENHILVGDDGGNLYLSTDKGEEWQYLFRIQNYGAITAIAISPDVSSDGIFFVGTEKGGIWKTINGGVSFFEVNEGISKKYVISFAMSPDYGKDPIIFASTWHEAVFRSNNGGNTWKKYSMRLTTDRQADTDKHRSPHFMDLRISKTFSKDKTIFLGGYDGLFKSTDGGHSWIQMETRPPKLMRNIALSQTKNGKYTIILTTFLGGIYLSDDQGKRWSIKNRGLVRTFQSDLVFSPNYYSDHQLLTASSGNLSKSRDKGNSWDSSQLRWPQKSWERAIFAGLKKLRVPTRISKRILGIPKRETIWPFRISISPDYTSDKTLYLGTRSGHGILRSTDGGLHFTQVRDSMGHKITSINISPNFLSDRTLYACARSEGVYKSMDRGDTWQPKNNGLLFKKDVKSLIKPNYRLDISPDYKIDNTVFVGTESGLFKTTNGGEKWKDLGISTYCGSVNVKNIAISPNYGNDKTVIVSVIGRGLFKSEDGGSTWVEVGTNLINNNYVFRFIKFSPLYAIDNTIYGASEEEFFKSTDRGNTWEMIKRPVRYENVLDPIQYEGEWTVARDKNFSASSISYSNVVHNKAMLNFVGTGVSWISTGSNKQGIAGVYIDGDFKEYVDQFNNEREVMVKSYSITDLPYGPHTIMIEVTENKNPKSSGNTIEFDAFDVF